MTAAQRRVRTASVALLLLAIGSASSAVMNFSALRAAAEIRSAFPPAVADQAAASEPAVPAPVVDWYLSHAYLVLAGELAMAALFGVLYVWSQRTPRSAILGALLLALPSTALAVAWAPSFSALAARLVLLALLARGLLR